MEEGGSLEIWGRMLGLLWGGGGVGPLSWEGVFMGVVCGEVFGWVGKCFANMPNLRLGWGIE